MSADLTPAQQEMVSFLRFVGEATERAQPSFSSNGLVSLYRYVLERGTWWEWKPLPPAIRMMTPKYCFDNTYKLVKQRRSLGLRYVEGFAVCRNSIMPIHHAWAVDMEGIVVDATWSGDDAIGDRLYLGIEYDIDRVRLARTPNNTSVLMDWPNGYPELRTT